MVPKWPSPLYEKPYAHTQILPPLHVEMPHATKRVAELQPPLRLQGVVEYMWPKYSKEHWREYRKNHPEQMYLAGWKRDLKKFGLTLEGYERLLKKQKGVCAICRLPERIQKRKLAVDHDHSTNKVRGLLCFKCNRALGGFNDNHSLLKNAMRYVKKKI